MTKVSEESEKTEWNCNSEGFYDYKLFLLSLAGAWDLAIGEESKVTEKAKVAESWEKAWNCNTAIPLPQSRPQEPLGSQQQC